MDEPLQALPTCGRSRLNEFTLESIDEIRDVRNVICAPQ